MNKTFSLWQIVPYFLILILIFVIYQMYQNGKKETEYNKRNDSLETINKEYQGKIEKLEKDNNELRTSIVVNEAGTEQNKIIYIKEKEKIKKQSANQNYNEVIEYLNEYKK